MIKQLYRNVSPDLITKLAPNEVFCYGANESYIHGAGAARQALKWGAVYRKGPFCGQTYGICTKDFRIQTLPLGKISVYVQEFLEFARSRPDLVFLCTCVGTGLAGYSVAAMAPLFFTHLLPPNVYLPAAFWAVYDAREKA